MAGNEQAYKKDTDYKKPKKTPEKEVCSDSNQVCSSSFIFFL